uniref:SAM domain-containing protein n=1 Tax=Bursaphelenchus xylophilus TaxID=6326 RepID=A0A1I7SWD2_BURXY
MREFFGVPAGASDLMDNPSTSKSTDPEGGEGRPPLPPPSSSIGSTENPIQRLTGMRSPTNLSEWQLQAILFKAKLVQYYDTFISLGGDDIDQIMASDENEFLEIMSLVGMAEKPLHVRRFQKTLAEFSADRLRFLNEQIPLIGFPPIPPTLLSTPETFYTAFQYLNPSSLPPDLSSFRSHAKISLPRSVIQSPSLSFVPSPSQLPSTSKAISPRPPSPSSQIKPIQSLVKAEPQPSTSRLSVGSEPWRLSDTPILTEDDINKIRRHVDEVLRFEPELGPKQSKRQVQKHRRLMEVMKIPESDPTREPEFRKYSAIYGSSKRNPEKALTFHEVLINEAASQICLRRPPMLTMRDRLFALARSAVRNAGFPGLRFMRPEERKARGERSTTPQSGLSNRSECSTPCPEELTRSHTGSVEPSEETSGAPSPKRSRQKSPE